MRILITGATGLVGKNLVDLCLERNIEVHFLTTRKDKVDSILNARGFHWNPSTGEIDTSCLDGVDTIINLAGAPIAKKWTAKHKENILQSRIQSLQTLHKALTSKSSHSIKSLVSASAIGIYPDSQTTFYDEKDEVSAQGFAAQVVEAWENETLKFKDLLDKVAIARIGLVLSEKGGALEKMAKPVQFGLGAAFGSGEQWQSWIHVDDLSRLLLFLSEKGLDGVYNAVAPNPVTQNKMVKELAKVLKKPLILPNVPKVMIRLLMGEMSNILISSQRVSSKKIEAKGFDFTYQNICRALEGIYTPVTVQETIS